jgi:hypothetical protein
VGNDVFTLGDCNGSKKFSFKWTHMIDSVIIKAFSSSGTTGKTTATFFLILQSTG